MKVIIDMSVTSLYAGGEIVKGIPVINRQCCGIVLLDEIEYIECSYRNATLHTDKGELSVSLKADDIETYLDRRFDRCLSTLFINHDKVKFMTRGVISFFSGTELYLGKKSFARAKKEYLLYIRNLQKTLDCL